ncbi:MAG: succinate dehydrogenase membrane anchor subunit [Gammaproteobacteria bacterium]|nr:MAG: succinate dehydrogenase membrane anchor subunit [Gammaproteobacteria bacterium]
MNGLYSPLRRARGLGAGKHAVHHWWMQRLTAIALLPLTAWLGWSVSGLVGAGPLAWTAWLAQPTVAVGFTAWLLALYYHAALGVQVVIEDYVHTPWLHWTLRIANTVGHAVLALAAVLAVIRIAVIRI